MRKTPIFNFFHIIYNVKKLFINIISIAINISKDVNDANINLLFFICFTSLLVNILSLSFLNSPFLYFMSKMISFAYSIKNTSPILFLLNIYAFILEDILTIVTKISSFFDTPVFGDGAKKQVHLIKTHKFLIRVYILFAIPRKSTKRAMRVRLERPTH